MAFIKNGDGKILSIVKTDDELTEEQKKTVKQMSTKQKTDIDANALDKASGR